MRWGALTNKKEKNSKESVGYMFGRCRNRVGSAERLGAKVEATLGSSDVGLERVLARRVDSRGGAVGLLLVVIGEELYTS